MTMWQNLLRRYAVKSKLSAWIYARGKSQNLNIALPSVMIHLGNVVTSYDDRAAPAISLFGVQL